MATLGAFCFPGTGHINPMTALARRLEQRGHKVVIFGIADCESRIGAAGANFHQIGASDYPPGTLARLDQRLSELHGLATFRFTVQRVRDTARMVLRDGPPPSSPKAATHSSATAKRLQTNAALAAEVRFCYRVAVFLHPFSPLRAAFFFYWAKWLDAPRCLISTAPI